MSRAPGRIQKPRGSSSKSSDRRMASGARAEWYLLSQKGQFNNARVIPQQEPSANSSIQDKTKPSGTVNTKGKQRQKQDTTLSEWDPKHFRLFVGNLGTDANDAIILKAFAKYPSVKKVKVPVDRNGTNKGYGFVAFEDPQDYLTAFKELNGKYIGHNPCVLKKANDLQRKKSKS